MVFRTPRSGWPDRTACRWDWIQNEPRFTSTATLSSARPQSRRFPISHTSVPILRAFWPRSRERSGPEFLSRSSPTSELTFPIGNYEIVEAGRRGTCGGKFGDSGHGRGIFAPGVRIPSPEGRKSLATNLFHQCAPLSIGCIRPAVLAARAPFLSPRRKGCFFFGQGLTLSEEAAPGQVEFAASIVRDTSRSSWHRRRPSKFPGRDENCLSLAAGGAGAADRIQRHRPAGAPTCPCDAGGGDALGDLGCQDDRGSAVATGIYFYWFAASSRPMVLLK